MNALQLKMARVALGLTVRQAAELADVSHDTITRIEGGQALKDSTLQKVRAALADAGVIFVDENGEGAGIRMRKFRVGDIVRLREAGKIAGITVGSDQTGIVTTVEVDTEHLGSKYRLTVRFGEVPVPLSAKDLELIKPVAGADEGQPAKPASLPIEKLDASNDE